MPKLINILDNMAPAPSRAMLSKNVPSLGPSSARQLQIQREFDWAYRLVSCTCIPGNGTVCVTAWTFCHSKTLNWECSRWQCHLNASEWMHLHFFPWVKMSSVKCTGFGTETGLVALILSLGSVIIFLSRIIGARLLTPLSCDDSWQWHSTGGVRVGASEVSLEPLGVCYQTWVSHSWN